MGLAAPKTKIKLSHDPNNTRWINNNDSFGHKILTSQGWKKGEYLGARNAPHAEFHSAANASHIRVTIKDDNLGLGAKVGTGVGHGECTGLDAFKNLLSRLNGKDIDEIENEQRSRDSIRRSNFVEKKWGSLRFVSAGFLVGDKIQDSSTAESTQNLDLAERDKRENSKAEENGNSSSEKINKKVHSHGKGKKAKDTDCQGTRVDETTTEINKPKRKRKLAELSTDGTSTDGQQVSITSQDFEICGNDEKLIAKNKTLEKTKKMEKKNRKNIEKKTRRELKKANKHNSKKSNCILPEASEPAIACVGDKKTIPTCLGGSGSASMFGRHAIRSKNIAQKRMASMDVASLNQIFMIKA